MRLLAPVLALAVLAGCVNAPAPSPAPHDVPAPPAPLVHEEFERADEPWAFGISSGCGMCMGLRGFADGRAEHHALFIFSSGRVVLIEHNGGPGASTSTQLAEGIAYDEDGLRALLNATGRGGGERWVVRVTTARLVDAAALDTLASSWRDDSADVVCTDSGVELLRMRNGSAESRTFSCGPADPSMAKVHTTLAELVEDARRLPFTGLARPDP